MVADSPPDSVRLLATGTDTRPPTIARLAQPQSSISTTFAVISDPHVTPIDWGTWKVYHRTEQRFRAAIDDINRREVDVVLSTGDLTKDGTMNEYICVSELLDELDSAFAAIPGNHDVPKTFDEHLTPPLESFKQRYAGGELPFVQRIGGIELVGLNSASTEDDSLGDTHGGRVSDSQLSWLSDTLPKLECPIVSLHHNLTRRDVNDTPATDPIYQLSNASELAAVLTANDVELVLSGHSHCPAVGMLNGVQEVVMPATSSFPQSYTLIHVDERGTEIQLIPLADFEGLKEAWSYARKDGREQLLTAATREFPLLDQWPVEDGVTQISQPAHE